MEGGVSPPFLRTPSPSPSTPLEGAKGRKERGGAGGRGGQEEFQRGKHLPSAAGRRPRGGEGVIPSAEGVFRTSIHPTPRPRRNRSFRMVTAVRGGGGRNRPLPTVPETGEPAGSLRMTRRGDHRLPMVVWREEVHPPPPPLKERRGGHRRRQRGRDNPTSR